MKIFRKWWFLAILAIVIIVIVIVVVDGNSSGRKFVVAERTSLSQGVSVTGRVKPAEDASLAFEKTGKIARVYYDVSDQVEAGDVIVSLENSELFAQLAEAEAVVALENAKLQELQKGTRPEEITIQETKVENAEVALGETRKNMIDKLGDAYTKSDDAIRGKADQLFVNPSASAPEFNFSGGDPVLRNEVSGGRRTIESILLSWKDSLNSFSANDDYLNFINTTKNNLQQIKSFLSEASVLISGIGPSSNLSQATIDGWKSGLATGRSNVNVAIENVTAAEEKIKNAESALTLEKDTLFLKKAGTVPEQLIAQEASLNKAKASVQNINAQIGKTVIRAPISGVVAKQEAKTGEIVSAGSEIVSIISDANYEIESNVPEADLAKIKIGDVANVTLDAYGEDILFQASIASIDPAETIIGGIPTYKTTLEFMEEDNRIRSGMTANIDILTAQLENVIAVPGQLIAKKDGKKFVQIILGNQFIETEVETGIIGSGGRVEIVSGLREGDKVLIP